MTARFEFKREDCWVGVFWRRSHEVIPYDGLLNVTVPLQSHVRKTLDVWVCLIPMFPLHIRRTTEVYE